MLCPDIIPGRAFEGNLGMLNSFDSDSKKMEPEPLNMGRVSRVIESLDNAEETISIDQKICVLETAKQILVYQKKPYR